MSRLRENKPFSVNHDSNTQQPFVRQTALAPGPKSTETDNQEKDTQKKNESSNTPFGAAPFVRQTVMAQAKLQKDQKSAEVETENQVKTGELENPGMTPKNAVIPDKTAEEQENNEGSSFTFSGKQRSYTLAGGVLKVAPFTNEEANDLATDTTSNKIILNGKSTSFSELYTEVFQPKPGIWYEIAFLDSAARPVLYMKFKKPSLEKEAEESVGQEANPATEPEKPSNDHSNEPANAPTGVTAPPTSAEAAPEAEAGTKVEEGSESTAETAAPEAPTGPYWKHEWQIDRFGNEAVFIWEVGGKRWRSNADRGYAYLRNMASKVPGDDGYDPRFEKFKHRPQASEGKNTDLNWWFKKTPGWDDKTKLDDGTADFKDLAEFKDAEHNKRGTGFYYMGYVFDPLIYEKLAAQKRERENAKYLGTSTNYKGYVNAENGIILHTTPSPTDPGYLERRSGKNKADYLIGQNSPVTVLGEGNEKFEGWVYVRSQSGEEGWIERRFLSKKREIEKKSAFPSYSVKPGDTLEGVIDKYYATYPYATGNDRRTVALAIYLFNKNKPGAGIYRDHAKYHNYNFSLEGTAKGVVDPWMKETRANYQSVELYAGGEILLPPKWFIDDMRQRGEVEKRPDFVNVVIEGGRVVQGFIDGVGEGFVDALVGTAKDLYDLVVGIFTGELFTQLGDMFKTLWDLGLDGVWNAIKDFGTSTMEELSAAWNNPNPYQRGKYFGEIVGAILFEVVLAFLTAGIGTAVRGSARATSFLTKVPKLLSKFKSMPLPDGATKHMDELKKLADGNKPDVDKPNVDKTPEKDKTDSDKDKADEEKKEQHATEVAAASAYISIQDAKSPSPNINVVLAHINATPGMKIPGKPYKAEKNAKGEGHYNISFNPDIYFDYTDGVYGNSDRDFDPRKDERFESLSQEDGKTRPSDKIKGEKEAEGLLKAERKGLVQNPRRPKKGGPDLDFQIDGPPPFKWCDIKTPVKAELRSLKDQASDIAKNIRDQKAGSKDVLHVVDLTNVPLNERSEFMKTINDFVGSTEGIAYVD